VSHRARIARVGAPVALLAGVTIAVLLVRAGIQSDAQPGSGVARPAITSGQSVYVIAAGDTLAGIAVRYNTTVDALIELNPGVDPVTLRIGERIRVR
jgi:hypothetical protein